MTLSKFVFASLNLGKVKDMELLCKPYAVTVETASKFMEDFPEETGEYFWENALIKAKYVALKSKLPALADDSGICIEALDNRPGVHSARWVESAGGYLNAFEIIRKAAESTNNYNAKFVCCLSLVYPGEVPPKFFIGEVKGTLVFPKRGSGGFGYDPIFVPCNHEQTLAEMDRAAKSSVSHRGIAFTQFAQQCLAK